MASLRAAAAKLDGLSDIVRLTSTRWSRSSSSYVSPKGGATRSEAPQIVLDANILIRAALGRNVRQILVDRADTCAVRRNVRPHQSLRADRIQVESGGRRHDGCCCIAYPDEAGVLVVPGLDVVVPSMITELARA